MAIEIRETIVTPDKDGNVVQIQLSDVALGDEGGSFRLVLHAKIRPYQTPTLAHLQRAAMVIAQDALTPILQRLAHEITEAGHDLRPRTMKG